MRGLESRINVINDKGCCLYQATRSSKLVEATHKKPDMKTASLGRRTRAGQHHRDPHQSIDCESRGPLIECIRILNRLTTELHAEASCIRTEISEIHDSFGEQHAEQNDVKKELFEMSKYVRILEHRLKQVTLLFISVPFNSLLLKRRKLVKAKNLKTIVSVDWKTSWSG